MHIYKVYKLINPKDNSIFYIGITSKPLHTRLGCHISESIRENKTQKHFIINDIIMSRRKPLIEVVEEIESDDMQEILNREQHFISEYFSKGHNLTNIHTKENIPKAEIPIPVKQYDPITLQNINFEMRRFIRNKREILKKELVCVSWMGDDEVCFFDEHYIENKKKSILNQLILLKEMEQTMLYAITSFRPQFRDKDGELIKDYIKK